MAFSHNPKIVTDGLVVCLDAGDKNSYPGSGATWSDVSGNGNDFTLYNSPTHNSDGYFTFDGVNQYGRSTNQIDLSSTNAVTVDVVFKVASVTTNEMIFEHTSNWNSEDGAFGAFTNSNGGLANSPTTDNDMHMNSEGARLDATISDVTSFSISTFIYKSSSVALYNNNVAATQITLSNLSAVSGFANDYTYLSTRAGTSFFDGCDISFFRIYSRELSLEEIENNYSAMKSRFGV